MSDRDLIAIGFPAGNDGVLHAPASSRVKLGRSGKFYETRDQSRRRQRHSRGALQERDQDHARGEVMTIKDATDFWQAVMTTGYAMEGDRERLHHLSLALDERGSWKSGVSLRSFKSELNHPGSRAG